MDEVVELATPGGKWALGANGAVGNTKAPSIDRSVDAADVGVGATPAGRTGGVGSLDVLCVDVVLGCWWLLPPHHLRHASAWGVGGGPDS